MSSLIGPRSLERETAALRAGEDGVSAMAERTCDRIDAVDPAVRAFLPEPDRRDRLRSELRSIGERWPRPADAPALYGVPVGVKDIVRVDGLPTRAGSALPPDALAGRQAAVVDRLRAAGALVAGKTVTAEFASSAPGPTRNPRALLHTPGGSSSGSAAAVATGMVPLAVGTQTLGSVVRPAAYCGVVGFKPGYGRIPTDGVIANAPSLDTLGVFASDVAGCALAASVLCDTWRPGRTPGPDRVPVLGVPVGPYLERAGAEALAAFESQLRLVRMAGFTVRRVPVMADFAAITDDVFVVNRYEVARVHTAWFAAFGTLYREQTRAAIRQGQALTPDEYRPALRRREDFRHRLAATMSDEGIDVWLAPSATGTAPPGLDSTGDPVMSTPWSYAGLPSVSLPAGRAADGLPFGLQCVGRAGLDEQLLDGAAALERVLAAAGQRPPEAAR